MCSCGSVLRKFCSGRGYSVIKPFLDASPLIDYFLRVWLEHWCKVDSDAKDMKAEVVVAHWLRSLMMLHSGILRIYNLSATVSTVSLSTVLM